jgi:hypothetical protein
LELVRDFVNSLDFLPGTDELDDPASLASWLIEHRLVATLPTLTDEDLARARSLREALRAFLLTNAGFPLPAEAAEDFDAAVGSVRLRTRAAGGARSSYVLPRQRGWSTPLVDSSRPCSSRSRTGLGPA